MPARTDSMGGGVALNDSMFSPAQFITDLVVAIVGSGIAVWGALWIADRTFRRDIAQERADRIEEDEKREQQERERLERLAEEEYTADMRSLEAVLAEIKLNMRSIDYMKKHPATLFPLRLDAFGLYLPRLVTLPDTVAEAIQESVMLVDRYNALGDWSPPARIQVALEARASLNAASHRIADYLQPDRASPGAPRTFWRLDYRDDLDSP